MKLRLMSTLVTSSVVAPLLVLGVGATATTAGAWGARPADTQADTQVSTRVDAQARRPSVRRVRDARGDVVRVTERKGKDVFTPAPARRRGDITSFKLAHREAAVVGTMKVRSLARGDRFFGAILDLRTRKATYTAVVFRSRVGEPFQTFFEGNEDDACAGLRYRLDYRRDLVRIIVPRACLGNPAWVRSRAVVDYFGPRGVNQAFFADAAPGNKLPRSPFLARAWHPGR